MSALRNAAKETTDLDMAEKHSRGRIRNVIGRSRSP